MRHVVCILFTPNEQLGGGGGGGALPDILFLFSFPCSADSEPDWPPCNKVVFQVGAANTLSVRNNNNHHEIYIIYYCDIL